MALKFNYNKTTIQQFHRQLAIREKALPILKNKEMALRKEVKDRGEALENEQQAKKQLERQLENYQALWNEFPSIVMLDKMDVFQKKIIGVKVPEVSDIHFRMADISWWNLPAWVPSGIAGIRQMIRVDVRIAILKEQVALLDTARKKTTQKVNLYEKVQIPAYEDAILKIKRFLEDKENISKAAQKIVKTRKERREAA